MRLLGIALSWDGMLAFCLCNVCLCKELRFMKSAQQEVKTLLIVLPRRRIASLVRNRLSFLAFLDRNA